jgi:hypothetical protein
MLDPDAIAANYWNVLCQPRSAWTWEMEMRLWVEKFQCCSRDPEVSIRVALRDVRCPRCNGHGRPRIIALARHPSV